MDDSSAGFDFSGRIGRTQYWLRILFVLLGVALMRPVALALVTLVTGTPRYASSFLHDLAGMLTVLGVLLMALVACGLVFAIVMGLASTVVCRLRDRGRSGWWLAAFGVAAYRLATDTSLWHGTPTISLAAGALLVWGAIELGVLPGRPSQNSAVPT